MNTIETTILQDDELLCSLCLGDFGVNLYLVYKGSDRLNYAMFLKGELLFSGSDYRPSPLVGLDSLNSIVDCLSFLTVQKGDVDESYFKGYSKGQLEWAKSRACEELKGLILDFEDSDSEYNEYAKNVFMQGFNFHANITL